MKLSITTVFVLSGVVLFIIYSVYFFKQIKVEPDPWDGEIDEDELDDNAQPICLNCSRPVDNPSQYYCPNCGSVTGEFTRYMPFVNIRFNYSIYAKMWSTIKDPKANVLIRIIDFFLILFFAPIMLIVAIPILVYRFIVRTKKKCRIFRAIKKYYKYNERFYKK